MADGRTSSSMDIKMTRNGFKSLEDSSLEESLLYISNKFEELGLEEKLDIDLTLNCTQDFEMNLLIDRKFSEFKTDILETIKKYFFCKNNACNPDSNSSAVIKNLKEENAALNRQLNVLTELLEVIVPLVKDNKQNLESENKKSLHGTNINNIDIINAEKNVTSISEDNKVLENNKESIIDQLNNVREQHRIRFIATKSINKPLKKKDKYENNRSPVKSNNQQLSNKLQQLANYEIVHEPTQITSRQRPARQNADADKIYIIGDSMVKHLKSSQLEKFLQTTKKVVVFPKPGATVDSIRNTVERSVNDRPTDVILHVGTNNLCNDDSPQVIAESIINLATDIATKDVRTMISGVVPRGDKYANKARLVNHMLKLLCSERNICLISHDNINPSHHLNGSKLHLNKKGNVKFSRNLVDYIMKGDQ